MSRITKTELEAWKCAGRLCFVRNGNVFDVTDFARLHPGGENPLKNNAGRDVTTLMSRENPHRHSDNAYKLMEQYCVGEFETQSKVDLNQHTNGQLNGQSNGQSNGLSNGLSSQYNKRETTQNGNASSAVQDPVDYDKSVLWQIVDMGEKYYEWTHVPVGRQTMRLFRYDFFEYFSTSRWYAVPLTWIPFIVMMCWLAIQQWTDVALFANIFGGVFRLPVPCETFLFIYLGGILLWTFLEYCLHRFLFHMEPPSTSKILIGLHFILHGQHHKVPFDPGRLVFPPVAAAGFIVIFYIVLTAVLPTSVAYTVLAGTVSGYICYDMTHYYLHHGSPSPGSYLQGLKTYHVRHHYEIQDKGFGISSKLWDNVFGTLIPAPSTKAE